MQELTHHPALTLAWVGDSTVWYDFIVNVCQSYVMVCQSQRDLFLGGGDVLQREIVLNNKH